MGVKGYKGFGPGMVCRGKQYAENTVFEEPETKICESGMHFCVPPLGVLQYYSPVDYEGRISEYAEVEAEADASTDDDIKYTTTKLRVGAKISLAKLAEAHVDWVKKQITCVPVTKTGNWSAATKIVDRSAATNTGYRSAATNTGDCSVATNTGGWSAATNTGDRSAATNTGDCSVATNTGDYSTATNTGYRSAATNSGNWSAAINTGGLSAATNTGNCSVATNAGNCSVAINTGNCSVAINSGNWSVATNAGYWSAAEVSGSESVAIVTGHDSKVRGALGCWIVAAECDDKGHILCVKAACVDGKKIKADTWYKLDNGEFEEVKHEEHSQNRWR